MLVLGLTGRSVCGDHGGSADGHAMPSHGAVVQAADGDVCHFAVECCLVEVAPTLEAFHLPDELAMDAGDGARPAMRRPVTVPPPLPPPPKV